MSSAPTAIVLFAHGSRDPLWRGPIDAVAKQMTRLSPDTMVCCAFLELMTPDLPEAIDALVQEGHRSIRIVPMFLGVGRHVREDLPRIVLALQQQHPDLQLVLQAPIGEQADVTLCMARQALASSADHKT